MKMVLQFTDVETMVDSLTNQGLDWNNRWIVPTNLQLLKRFGAHINVEWCNKSILSNTFSNM
jgi:hypothetical protein